MNKIEIPIPEGFEHETPSIVIEDNKISYIKIKLNEKQGIKLYQSS